jgi:prevent-host-death family protein
VEGDATSTTSTGGGSNATSPNALPALVEHGEVGDIEVAAASRNLPRDPDNHLCITRDTVGGMNEVSIRELRNRGGHVIDRVEGGERVTITRSGRPVAELRPLRRAIPAEVLIERWARLPYVDPLALRRDVDGLLDPSL